MADISVTSGYDGLNLPYSPEAEQSVLGAVLLDSSCLDRIAEILPRAEYFHLANHRMIYDADAGNVHPGPAGGFRHRAGQAEAEPGL